MKQNQSRSKSLQIVQTLGMINYLINKIIFRPPKPSFFYQYLISLGYSFEMQQDYTQFRLFIEEQKQKHIKNSKILDINPVVLIHSLHSYVPLIYLFHKQDNLCYYCSVQCSLTPEDSNTSFKKKNSVEKAQILIIYSHGNACDIGDVYQFAEKMATMYQVDLIIYDYTGYGLGKSKYHISEQTIYDDLQSVIAFATNKLKYQLSQIILVGFSMGSGPSVELAARYAELGGLILLAPLASVLLWYEKQREQIDLGEQDSFSNIKKIKSVKCATLILHGCNDRTINIRHSRLLKQRNQKVSLIEIDGVDHNDIHDCIVQNDSHYSQIVYYFIQDVIENVKKQNKDRNQQEETKRKEKLLELVYQDLEILQDSLQSKKQRIKGSSYSDQKVKPTAIDCLQVDVTRNSSWYTQNTEFQKQSIKQNNEQLTFYQQNQRWNQFCSCNQGEL